MIAERAEPLRQALGDEPAADGADRADRDQRAVPTVAEVQQILREQHEDRRGHLHAQHRQAGGDRQTSQHLVAATANAGPRRCRRAAVGAARCIGSLSWRVAARSVKHQAAQRWRSWRASKPNGSHIAATNSTLPIGVPTKLLAAISAANRRPLAFSSSFGRNERRHHRLRRVVEEHLGDTQHAGGDPQHPDLALCDGDRNRQRPDDDGPKDVGANHQQAVVDAIDDGADRQRQQQPRQRSRDADERDRQLAAGQARGEQR